MYERERNAAARAVAAASGLCRKVQSGLVSGDTLTKGDRSPVTVADYAVQAAVSLELAREFPSDPLVGEEDATALRDGTNGEIRERVVRLVRSGAGGEVGAGADDEAILGAIDRGTDPGGGTGRRWTLDPIDGTKGFLRGEQYAIALALLEDGEVVVGVLGCPNLPWVQADPSSGRGCLLSAVRGEGSWISRLDRPGDERPLQAARVTDPSRAVFCESVESAHSSHGDSARIAARLQVEAPPLRIDSQCKYAVLARGDVSIYLRLPTSETYREKIWDHAAGSLVVTEAGATVTDVEGRALDFSRGRRLEQNRGIVAASAGIHPAVLAAVKAQLQETRQG